MGVGREGGREGASRLRARSLATGIGGRDGRGGAVRDLARRLDPGRVFCCSAQFFFFLLL